MERESSIRRSPAELLPLVYEELRRLAGAYMRGERRSHTLQSTALVHEAYLRLEKHKKPSWKGKTHFFAIAAVEMRRVLVEHARARNAEKRGGGLREVTLDEGVAVTPRQTVDILALDEALTRLAALNARQAVVAEYRIFAGLTEAEMATILGVSERTVREDWRIARTWLRRQLSSSAADAGEENE